MGQVQSLIYIEYQNEQNKVRQMFFLRNFKKVKEDHLLT